MRVVAARFQEQRQAAEALDLLRRELQPPDLAVAPLACPEEPSAADALLAGRFPDEQARAAVELVERAGGEIVADIDERWTGMNSAIESWSGGTSGTHMATPADRGSAAFRFE